MDLKIVAIMAIVLLSLGAMTGLVIAPASATQILAVVGPTIVGLMVLLKAERIEAVAAETQAVATEAQAHAVATGLKMDGRLDQVLSLVQANAKASGVEQERTGVFQELPPVTTADQGVPLITPPPLSLPPSGLVCPDGEPVHPKGG